MQNFPKMNLSRADLGDFTDSGFCISHYFNKVK